MHSYTKTKKIKIIIFIVVISLVIIFLPIVSTIVGFIFGDLGAKIDGGINKGKITHYLKKTYNEDLVITDFDGGEWDWMMGRGEDVLTAQSKENGGYLFTVKILPYREKKIVDERNIYHYGNALKKNIEDNIVSMSSHLEIISDAEISGVNIYSANFVKEKDEINSVLNTLCADNSNTIFYDCVINKDSISNKSECLDTMYAIYEYLWQTKCEVYIEITIVSNGLYRIAEGNLLKELRPLEINKKGPNVYLQLSMNLSSNRYQYKDIKENSDRYLTKEEFTDLVNKEWLSSSRSND